jgi:hypothetical protein
MTESEPTVLPYASTRERSQLTVGGFIFHFIATAMFIGLLLLPFRVIIAAKSLYEDFKLELPAAAQITFDVYDILNEIHANIWLWALPFVVPFFVVRIRREYRDRLMLIAVLLAGFIGFYAIFTAFQVLQRLITGMTSTKP